MISFKLCEECTCWRSLLVSFSICPNSMPFSCPPLIPGGRTSIWVNPFGGWVGLKLCQGNQWIPTTLRRKLLCWSSLESPSLLALILWVLLSATNNNLRVCLFNLGLCNCTWEIIWLLSALCDDVTFFRGSIFELKDWITIIWNSGLGQVSPP